MKLNHLAISVTDQERSRRFYVDVLGLAASVRKEEDGWLLTTDDRFELALLDGQPPQERERIHFGFGQERAEDVWSLRQRLLAGGVREVEWWDMAGFVSMKFLDPDGYIVEVFWESTYAGA